MNRGRVNECCVAFKTMRIPLAIVDSFYKTSSSCHISAIVFVTKRGRHICVDPSASWVRNHVAVMDSAPQPLHQQ
ncbi:hypothetical protein ANANG_G00034870 [Anguilla anguilla]|uniref:Chemokine interleukin-8-like domain-containing protein n=1 Tax=Anguilla anguilla TaxID=7936 RepID=A0A9D3S3K7_ANGAN|nr:hypothetical protein ANANG_G00034870 [Anguilla anguilla]